MEERVGVGIYSTWVEGKSGKGSYGREGWENQGKGHMGERVGVMIYCTVYEWRENQGKGHKNYGREGWGDDVQYTVYEWRE